MILYTCLEFVAFVLFVVGTPIDMFRRSGEDTLGNTYCISLWGLKKKCYSTTYNYKINTLWELCSGRKNLFKAAEITAILTILILFVCFMLAFLACCCCKPCTCCIRLLLVPLTIASIGTGAATWGCMASSYNSSNGKCPAIKKDWSYGAGFGLLVTAWVINVINMVFLLLPC